MNDSTSNQLNESDLDYSSETNQADERGRWKSKISLTLKTNPSASINCPAKIYVHIMKDISLWTIYKVVLNHLYPCCPDRTEMLKQHRELSMFVHCTIETNKNRSSKKYQSFVAAAVSH
ncbi:hypothetical protein Ahy_B04g073025 [Arachis hypogaea]|uniref:Uncharacterized protein n=1 Tax=Arachis hypogaea TaxID=3818 RepID=A0A444ZPC9_ARAHY|nr:hypothetical protein Ahy_B04g073025 [Arachis hypogaea]